MALDGQSAAWGKPGIETGPFELGVVTVTAARLQVGEIGGEQVASVVTQKDMRRHNRGNVGDAVNLLSGVTVSTNLRNEKTVYLRGYDSRQAPLFIDGIPVYVPYDGYVDFSRFTTADLAAIQVVKGFSSVAYGPNTLGGAINLVSRKPRAAFEGDVSAGFASGNEAQGKVNVGSNQGPWYMQASASYLKSDYFRMSSDFTPTATEDGGSRNNSYRKDDKFSVKIGLTPNDGDEYAISYYKQNGEKGQPPATTGAARYWKWPFWDKESLYFISNTALGGTEALKVRLYQDKYGNGLDIYTNATYSALSPNAVAGKSTYDDKTQGGSIELSSSRFDGHEIKFVTHYKVDKHIARDGALAITESFRDTLLSYAVEDNIQLNSAAMLSLGVANHTIRPQEVNKPGSPFTLPPSKSATNGQVGLFYGYNAAARLYATVAQKTRLPTLKDRYSARFATFVENPALQPEASVNYEAGYRGSLWQGVKAEAAVFYNDISDRIQQVFQPGQTSCTAGFKCQMRNVGKVRNTGLELGLSGAVAGWLELGGNYTYQDLRNISDPATKITDVPSQKLALHALVRPGSQVDVIAFAESGSARWSSNTVKVGGFTTLDLKAVYRPNKRISAEIGATNLTDKNYSLADGFPSPGRMWFANATYQF